MSYVLDTTTTDSYQYLRCPGSSSVTLQVSNAQISVGFGTYTQGQFPPLGAGNYSYPDEPYLPSLAGLSRQCDEIRVKSYTPGTPANIKIIAR